MTFWQFIEHNWLLAGFAILLFIALIYVEQRVTTSQKTTLSAQDATLRMREKGTLIVDLSTAESFAKGHIAGAKNFTEDSVEAFQKQFKKHQERLVILACPSGATASQWVAKLRKQGFSETYAINGGLQAWRKAQLPLVKATEKPKTPAKP